MARNCVLIPVHPPKTNWLMGFLHSLQGTARIGELDYRIVLAASNFHDLSFFNKLRTLMPCSDMIDIICVESYMVETLGFRDLAERYRHNVDRCIVNVKKMIALSWAVDHGYDWIACIDCDVASMSHPAGFFDHLIRNYETGLYFGQTNWSEPIFGSIIGECSSLFPLDDQDRLRDITMRDACYAWFFDVPLYKASDYKAFLAHVTREGNTAESWFCRLNFFSFEHLLFLNWRCLQGDARLIDLHDMGIDHIPEHLNYHDLTRISARHGYEPAWATYREFIHNPDMLHRFPDLTLAYHVDR